MSKGLSRRCVIGAAAALAAGTAANAVGIASASSDDIDPIFAAIERERVAYAKHYQSIALTDAAMDEDEAADLHDRQMEDCDAWIEAVTDFCMTVPGSFPGVLAMLAHVEERTTPNLGELFYDNDEQIPLLLASVATAIRNLTGGGV